MKIFSLLLQLLFLVSCAKGKERTFTGSTPAGKEVRIFLGIPLTDSVDFIRWKIVLNDRQFQVSANYGIGKPNTNGFYNGGKQFTAEGKVERDRSHYKLQQGESALDLFELNENLIHFMDGANSLLNGNGGWSYTLNNTSPVLTRAFIPTTMPPYFGSDSLVYAGRTPCKIPGLGLSPDCYKIKWKIVLYPGAEKNAPGRFIVYGTNWRKENLEGSWEFSGPKDRLGYTLKDKSGKELVHLVKLGDLVLFTDSEGNMLVGDEDFSYTLSKL